MATRKVRASYQEIIDMHTEADHVTAVGIHTPTGDFPHKMFKGYFEQYKKYKYLGCSIKFIPLARLPVDPLQVGFESGEQMNPVDLANPILFHGCHGDDLGVILNSLYGNDDGISDSLVGLDGGENYPLDVQGLYLRGFMERLYYKALTDKSWKKAHIQRGFQKSGLRPLVYSLATNRQIMPSLALGEDVKTLDSDEFGDPVWEIEHQGDVHRLPVENRMQLFTPRLTRLGWMDTRNVITTPTVIDPVTDVDDEPGAILKALNSEMNYAQLPKLFMGCILLPPSTSPNGFKQYFRVIINHYFAFAQFRGISFQPDALEVPTYWNKNDSEDLFDMEDGHYNPVEMPGEESGGGGDEPTITVTAMTFKIVNDYSETLNPIRIWIKYPGVANFVPFHDFSSVNAGASAVWQTVNVPVGSIVGDTFVGGTNIVHQNVVVDRSQSNNVYELTHTESGSYVVRYPVSLNESKSVDPDYKVLVVDEL